MSRTRLPFELDQRAEAGALSAPGGVPLLIEAFRVSGAAAVVDEQVAIKRRQRGLTASERGEGLFSLGAAGGERCEDLAPRRADAALALLLGHGLPAPQTARAFPGALAPAGRRIVRLLRPPRPAPSPCSRKVPRRPPDRPLRASGRPLGPPPVASPDPRQPSLGPLTTLPGDLGAAGFGGRAAWAGVASRWINPVALGVRNQVRIDAGREVEGMGWR